MLKFLCTFGIDFAWIIFLIETKATLKARTYTGRPKTSKFTFYHGNFYIYGKVAAFFEGNTHCRKKKKT